jgi:hypothetical protein
LSAERIGFATNTTSDDAVLDVATSRPRDQLRTAGVHPMVHSLPLPRADESRCSMADSRFPGLNPADARIAEAVFEFVQFLLDDDANLTPAGNLTGPARQKLRSRLQELVDAETLPDDASAEPGQEGETAAAGPPQPEQQ